MPRTHARAAILSVGDELILGQTLDTNGRWLAQRLTDMGIVPVEHATVADDLRQQAQAITRLATTADVVLCTGGLGPTADDLTREALANAMGDVLIEDPLALAQLEAMYASRGRTLTPLNRLQAQRPSRGEVMPNAFGTAPGLRGVVRAGERECDVFCMPGPPRELFPMFEQHVAPRLSPPTGRTVRTRVLHSFGLAESELAQRLGTLMARDATPLVGTTASGGVVSVRIRYEGALPAIDADALLDDTERRVREAIGAYVFARGDRTLQDAVLALLRSQGHTLGVVESCTGGLLGEIITQPPGSSSVFRGGLITYSNALKSSLAGVDDAQLASLGAVSAEVARAMAIGGVRALACDHCLAITGIAGPDGAVPARPATATQPAHAAKPVGTVFVARASRASVGEPDTDVRRFAFTGDRQSIREWSARTALAMLWQHAAGLPPMRLLREVE